MSQEKALRYNENKQQAMSDTSKLPKEEPPKSPEELLHTIEVITYAGQEIPLNEEERKVWDKLTDAERRNKAANIRKSVKNGLMKWVELGELKFLVNTEKGNKANKAILKAQRDAAVLQHTRKAFKGSRNLRLQAMRQQATKKVKIKPQKEEKLVHCSEADKLKIRKRIKELKQRAYRQRDPKTPDEMKALDAIQQKITRLKEWLKPRKSQHG